MWSILKSQTPTPKSRRLDTDGWELASWALDEGRPGEALALLTDVLELVADRDVPDPLLVGKQLAEARIEHVVLVRNSVTPFIERGLKEADFKGQLTWFEDALTAYAALPHLTVSGDVVVLQNDWPDNYV